MPADAFHLTLQWASDQCARLAARLKSGTTEKVKSEYGIVWEVWELINIRLARLPGGRRILDSFLSQTESVEAQSGFTRLLEELMTSDRDFFRSLEKLYQASKGSASSEAVAESEQPKQESERTRGDSVAPSADGDTADADVQFTTFYPKALNPDRWYNLLAYVHLPKRLEEITADSRRFLDVQKQSAGKSSSTALQTIKRGAEITAVPEMPGCTFNPQRKSILWLEDWHRLDFRMRTENQNRPSVDNFPVLGRVAFYVGPLLIAETRIWAEIGKELEYPAENQTSGCETHSPYQSIFVSYSHKDTLIVERLASAYKALGMQYLRDVESLRSGEKWNSALLKMVMDADIFQLYWSKNAQQSKYVEQEWRYALSLRRDNFIRPVWWEKPIPAPPEELGDLHFTLLEL